MSKKSSLFDAEVYRVYKCTDDTCDASIGVTQAAKDPWLIKCPFCEKDTLVIHSGSLKNIHTLVGVNSPTTLGSLAEQNTLEKKKKGESTKREGGFKPWWRKDDKVNFNILKNPKRYIETGKIG